MYSNSLPMAINSSRADEYVLILEAHEPLKCNTLIWLHTFAFYIISQLIMHVYKCSCINLHEYTIFNYIWSMGHLEEHHFNYGACCPLMFKKNCKCIKKFSIENYYYWKVFAALRGKGMDEMTCIYEGTSEWVKICTMFCFTTNVRRTSFFRRWNLRAIPHSFFETLLQKISSKKN